MPQRIVLLKFNAPAQKIELYRIVSIDAGNGILTVTTRSGQAYVGYHIKFE